ncbi:ADP-ribose pyrophosphatase YjhB (NUDIX family) [Anoxybacillus calidus]|jgi:ADP-ribose pyrophosphatase YjhB (NUDIX family)|uniref:ADP-ribose pyrophosphatase YjhB (NUDIX family) n=1 Tax=[Anoxybacillus] calidus TaxID=575178 RepID=A0A7W0BV82_9BACL|nr:ADP-ribose pyrophosphatase YjhB (NUDIX family) [Anoxybacillus calidus]
MEIGETFEETAKREVLEETGLQVKEIQLFGIYSGETCFVTYPNGD